MLTDEEYAAIRGRTSALWPELRGKRLFVTGGTGFFGRWVLSLFARANDEWGCQAQAVVLTRNVDRARRRLGSLADHAALALHEGRVTQFDDPPGSFDFLLHLAGEPHGPRYATHPVDMAEEMVAGTRSILRFAAATRVRRLLYISTGAVYGPQSDRATIDEDTPPRAEPSASRRAYAEAKKSGEELALASGVPTIIARPFAFVGPGLPLDANFAASQFLADGLAGRPIRVQRGSVVRSYLYAADLAEWLWTMLIRGQPGRAYNVGSDRPTTLADLASVVAEQCGVKVEVENEGHDNRYVPSTRRAREELNLSQTVDLVTAVRRTVHWNRERGKPHPVIEEDLRRIVAADLPWQQFAGATVLVSGAAGFLPAYMVETLLGLGDAKRPARVIALVRNRERAMARFGRYGNRRDLQLIVQDVNDPLPTDLRADVIIHAAGHASPKYYGVDPVGTIAPNVTGTANLLELARRSGSRCFLFFSTSEVYGLPPCVPTPEDSFGALDPIEVRSCYAESKRLGENMCVAYAHQHGVPAKIVRPFHTYGPGMRLDDGRVFSDFVADVVARRSIVLRSPGTATRSFCYLADAVIGFFTVLLRGEVGQAYNVGNPNGEISIRGLAELMVGLFPERGLKVASDELPRGNDYLVSPVTRSCPDIARIRAWGWEPTTGLADGFRRTVESYG
jgi:UDP-glucuronate decarboxylase